MKTTNHGRDRMLERGISPDELLDTVNNGKGIKYHNGFSVFRKGRGKDGKMTAIFNENDCLITAYVDKERKRNVEKRKKNTGLERHARANLKLMKNQMREKETREEMNINSEFEQEEQEQE